MHLSPRLDRRLMLAEHFGCDYADLADSRYQPSRFVKIPVYVEGGAYWCVTKPGETPPVSRDGGFGTNGGFDVEWVAMPADTYPLSRYAGRGITIWRVGE